MSSEEVHSKLQSIDLMEDRDIESIEDENDDKIVQLGFGEEIEDGDDVTPPSYIGHNDWNWNHWDGGQIGGRPSWLNPRDIECTESPFKCPDCCSIMRFVLQLYAPLNSDDAFHRTLYVYVCPSSKGCERGVLVKRCQLPQINDFYPQTCRPDDDDDDDTVDNDWNKHLTSTWNVNTCAVCNQRAVGGKCPKQKKWFCCRDHQKEHLRATTKKNSCAFPSLFKTLELVVEEEPPETKMRNYDDASDNLANSPKTLFSNDNNDDDDDDDDDAALEQADLNQIVAGGDANVANNRGTTDPETIGFYARIGRADGKVKDQCLRYQRWQESDKDSDFENGGPLWISSTQKCPTNKPPPCEYCGAERKFEFQIMPQMLHFLRQQSNDCDLNNNIEGTKNQEITAQQKQALMAASDILERAENSDNKEQATFPPSELKEKHNQILDQYKKGLGLKTNDNKEVVDRVDWGIIAVYTCTASCSGSEKNKTNDNIGNKNIPWSNSPYRTEYAWRQPGLD